MTGFDRRQRVPRIAAKASGRRNRLELSRQHFRALNPRETVFVFRGCLFGLFAGIPVKAVSQNRQHPGFRIKCGMTGDVAEVDGLPSLVRETVTEKALHVAEVESAVGYDGDGPGFVIYFAEGVGELRHEL